MLGLGLSPLALSDVLQGSVETENYLRSNRGPSLNRGDLGAGKDPFSATETGSTSPVQELLTPPNGAFDVHSQTAPKPPPDFSLHLDESGAPEFNGQPLPGKPADLPAEQPTAMMPTAGPFNPESAPAPVANDPDKAPDMQLAWDAWHRRVAETVYQRFVSMSHAAFKYSRPLSAYVSYTVTRSGKIVDAQLQQRSANVAFNALVLLVVNSLSGEKEILAFPPGSRRMSVEKGGLFTENYSPQQGFKFTTGDRETIHTQ
jgi:hypothetical protein